MKTGAAFTIVELLTVMSIIVVLIGLLVPALNRVKRYAFIEYKLAHVEPPSDDHMNRLRELVESCGVKAQTGG